MVSNSSHVSRCRMFLITSVIMVWPLLGLSAVLSPQPVEVENPPVLQSRAEDDVITIFGRDISPDILATSVPVASSHNGGQDAPTPSHNNFLLRSSSSNVSGIGGNPLHAIPIMASDLSEILLKTQADLRSRKGEVPRLYRFDTPHWSFLANMASVNLHYGALQAVVTRLLKLASANTAPREVVSTRVGVLLNDTIPVADIAILPCRSTNDSSDAPFFNFGNQDVSSSQPNEVFEVTPSGSECKDQVINETSVLAPFINQQSASTQKDIVPRSLEAEMFVPLARTGYRMGYRLWYDPVHRIPVEVKAWAMKGAVYAAMYSCVKKWLAITPLPEDQFPQDYLSNVSYTARKQHLAIDSGDYVVGNMHARLFVEWVDHHPYPHPLIAMLILTFKIMSLLLAPLEQMGEQDNVYAMEGEIRGSGNGTAGANDTSVQDGKDLVARWQISVRDKDEL